MATSVILGPDATPYSFRLSLSVLHLRDRRFRSLAIGTTTRARPVQEEVALVAFGGARLPHDPVPLAKSLVCLIPTFCYTGTRAEPRYSVWPRISAPFDRPPPSILAPKPDVAARLRPAARRVHRPSKMSNFTGRRFFAARCRTFRSLAPPNWSHIPAPQHSSNPANSTMSRATKSQAPSGPKSFDWRGPYSVGRATNAVFKPRL